MVTRANARSRRHRRPPLHLRQLGLALRGRLQPLLPRQGRRRRRRPGLLPGPRLARHLRPGLRRGPAQRGAARQLPLRGRPATASPPTRTRGSCRSSGSTRRSRWASDRSPPSTRPASTATCTTAGSSTPRQPGLGLRRRRRVRRARDQGGPLARRPRAPRQPDLRRQLQPAAPRRPGARQRQDHPGARGRVPRQRLERDQGDLGIALGRAARPRRRRRAGQQDEHHASTATSRSTPPSPAPTSASTSSGPTRGCRTSSSTSPTTTSRRCPAAATTTASSTPPTRRPSSTPAHADRDPRQDDQGLDARHRDRGAQRHAPDQEDDPRAARSCCATGSYLHEEIPDEALEPGRAALLPARRGLARVRVPDRAPATPRRLAPPPRRPRRGRVGLAQPADATFAEFWAGSRGQAVSTTMAFARLLRNLLRDPNVGQLRRADHPRRGPHLRSRRPLLGGEDLRPRRPALHLGRLRAAAAVLRERAGPDPRGGHHRGRRDGELHRRGDLLRHLGPADAAVLPLLLDVRLPARRRPDLGLRPTPAAEASCSAAPPGARRSTAKGLQHEDGHSLLLASVVPNVMAYDPAFAYEVATIVAGRHRATCTAPNRTDVIYYLTLYNENYQMPAHRHRPGRADPHGHHPRPLPLRAADRPEARPASSRRAPADDPVLRERLARGDASAPSCSPPSGASRPRRGRRRATRHFARTRSRSSAGTASTRCRAARPVRDRAARLARPVRSSPSPTS